MQVAPPQSHALSSLKYCGMCSVAASTSHSSTETWSGPASTSTSTICSHAIEMFDEDDQGVDA